MNEESNYIIHLLDFSFTKFVSESLIRIIYVVGVILAIIAVIGLIFYAFSINISYGIGSVILSPVVLFLYILFIRVIMEIFIVVFRIADYLKIIAENTQKGTE